jgi:hypothetical protein
MLEVVELKNPRLSKLVKSCARSLPIFSKDQSVDVCKDHRDWFNWFVVVKAALVDFVSERCAPVLKSTLKEEMCFFKDFKGVEEIKSVL